jgi:hypothetical protein
MTTILADWYTGQMAADTAASDGDRQWPNHRKVWRVRGALIGFCGHCEQAEEFSAWYRDGALGDGPPFKASSALVMTHEGLYLYAGSTKPMRVLSGRDAIGTGGKAALCAYDALQWQEIRKAVQIACRYDAGSRPPVRLYTLKR